MKDLIKLWKIVPICMLLFFILVAIKAIEMDTQNVICLLLAVIVLVICYIICKKNTIKEKINDLSNGKMLLICIPIIIIHTILMIVCSMELMSKPINDLGTVFYSALEIVENGKINTEVDEHTSCYGFYGNSNNDYFINYQNNIMILLILSLLFKVVKVFGIVLTTETAIIIAQIFNIICIELTIIFGMLILRKKVGNYATLLFLMLSCSFIPFYINSFRFYTDTIVMPFIMLMLYISVKLEDKLKMRYSIILYILLGIVSFLAIKIKQSAAIVFIAIFIYYIFKKDWKKIIQLSAISLPIFILLLIIFNVYIRNAKWIDFTNEETAKIPTISWLALGMSEEGGYNQGVINAQKIGETTIKEKENIVKNILKEELSKYNNIIEFINFEFKKAVSTWIDGKYYQGNHVTSYYEKSIIHEFILPDGKFYKGFDIVTKTFSFFVLGICIVVSCIQLKKKDCPEEILIELTIIGIAIFLSFWETKARYLLSFTPLFLMLMAQVGGKIKVKEKNC